MSQSQHSTFILVVADNPAARAELALALATMTSVHTLEAASVAEAVGDLQVVDQRIDLVVIDMEMSGSGAVTLTRKIREVQTLGPRNIAVLLIGGNAGTPHYQAAVRLGVQGYLPRPFTAAQLRAALRAALIRHAMEPASRPVQSPAQSPARRDAPDRPQTPEALHDAQSDTVPFANKPFRHGLQSLMRSTVPLTADEAFGFEPAPSSIRPRPMKAPPESAPVMSGLRFAVA